VPTIVLGRRVEEAFDATLESTVDLAEDGFHERIRISHK
jgi:hypothetical protein